MAYTWEASIYCRFENQLALGHNTYTGQWEAISTKVRKGERPQDSATRIVSEVFGAAAIFLPIHQLFGAPPGLVLYSEYPVSPDEIRLDFLFLGEIETKTFKPQKWYDTIKWVQTEQDLPRDMIPQVRAAFPYVLMAASGGNYA